MTKRLWSILIKNIRIPEFFSVHFNLHFLDPMQLPHSHIHRFHGAAAVWADAIAKTDNRCAAVGTIDTNSSLASAYLCDILDVDQLHIEAVLFTAERDGAEPVTVTAAYPVYEAVLAGDVPQYGVVRAG